MHVNTLENDKSENAAANHEKARTQIREYLTAMSPLFQKSKYVLGDEFSMLDVALAPLLWRLDYYGIELSKTAAPLMKYAERVFSRPAYIDRFHKTVAAQSHSSMVYRQWLYAIYCRQGRCVGQGSRTVRS